MNRELFDPDHRFRVGDRVIITGGPRREQGDRWGTVTKVGRTLLHVTEDGFTRPTQYRLDGEFGRGINSEWANSQVVTPEENRARLLRSRLIERLRELGWQTVGLRQNTTSNQAMQKMIDALLWDRQE